ncbi:regulator of chromosome condensation 1/beta-lactamase-inhibitor protein II [Crassisporium funariophilum]|nr:regulator of chromosome condensation 1/beta-lactamase-inhibitor protein II [Crassisporium funariophilum]
MPHLLSSGSNAHGQLGHNCLEDSHTFQRCSFANHPPHTLPLQTFRVIDVATGANHTLLLLEMTDSAGSLTRELWGCGDGRAGQLGARYQEEIQHGASATLFRKIMLSFEEEHLENHTLKHICATWETSYVVLSLQGKGDIIISMGSNDFGDLGVGSTTGGKMKKDFHIVKLDNISTTLGVHLIPAGIQVDTISSGQRHVIAHLRISQPNGVPLRVLVGWGASRHGQLGGTPILNGKPAPFISLPQVVVLNHDDPSDPVASSALGIHHSLFLHDSGRVSGLGSDRKGQLSGISFFNKKRLVSIGCTWNGSHAVSSDEAGQSKQKWDVMSCASNSHGQHGSGRNTLPSGSVTFPLQNTDTGPVGDVTDVRIACGSEHVMALFTRHSLNSSLELWGWGWNEHGNLGTGTTEDLFFPEKIWPNEGSQLAGVRDVMGIWGGSGTTWIYCEGG